MSRSSRLLPLALLLCLPLACSEPPVRPDRPAPPGPSPDLVDAGHTAEAAGFYFLPPMTEAPSATGTFDADLAPVVTICEGEVTDCGTPVAEFTTTSGPGSETVRVVVEDEHYIVSWHTDEFDLDPALTYRVVVSVVPAGASDPLVLGYADVALGSTGGELKNTDTGEAVPLKEGRTLPIKFRIETGVVGRLVVEPGQAEIEVGGTQPFTATLYDLHGAVLTAPAVSWSSDDEAVATVDGSGVATGQGGGTATITATSQRVSDDAELTVTAAASDPGALDLNGDGLADLLARSRPAQFSLTRDVYVHEGTGSGLSATGSLALTSPVFNGFATNGWNMGDVHDDGADDVAIASRLSNQVYLYDGTSTGLETVPFFDLTGPDAVTFCNQFSGAGSCFGGALGSGDVNADGFADLVVGAKEYVYLYAGSATGFSSPPSQVLRDPIFSSSSDGYGTVLAVGDFNGDGYDDVVTGADEAGGGLNGLVYVYDGSASGLTSTPATLAPGSECQFFCGFGTSVAADDFDGDGIDDLAVGAPRAVFHSGAVFYFRGSASGMATSPTAAVTGSGELGHVVAALGDFDGDGYADLAASGIGTDVTILGGGASGLATAGSVQGPGAVSVFGQLYPQTVLGVGDVNGDGRTDLAVSQAQLDPDDDGVREGALWIYHGTSSPSGTSPDQKLGASGTFRYSVIENLGYNPLLDGSP